jgi:hypothetical protein
MNHLREDVSMEIIVNIVNVAQKTSIVGKAPSFAEKAVIQSWANAIPTSLRDA